MFLTKLKFWWLMVGLLFSVNLFALNNRLIIKYKPNAEQAKMAASGKLSTKQLNGILMQPLASAQVNKLSHIAGMKVKDSHAIGTGAHVLILEKNLNQEQLDQIINKIKQDSAVEYVEEDKKVKHMAAANPDKQWDMGPPFTPIPNWAGDNFISAWGRITGNPGNGVTVAVIDTGYTPHPNVLSNLQPLPNVVPTTYGYQFISDCRVAGSCIPSTPDSAAFIPPRESGLDLGDYLTQAEIDNSNKFFDGCPVRDTSSWHGSHVTGTVVADGFVSESRQIAGGAWGARVVPVRVLGKCGGSSSDIINGMAWAAGVHPNIPNLNPAQVLNLSLGGSGACGNAYQDVINQINAPNVNGIIVIAAGNSSANFTNFRPANCQNVISVSAKGPTNALASYSNFGMTTITASGGDSSVTPCPGGICGIYSTIWASPQAYNFANGSAFAYYQGTSMATPHVAAIVANVISVLNNIPSAQVQQATPYNLALIINILRNSASTLTNPCNAQGCATSLSLNAENAIINAQNVAPALNGSLTNMVFTQVNVAQTVTFSNPGAVITLGNIVVSSGFTNSPASTCKAGLVLNTGATCTVIVSANSGIRPGTAGILRVVNTNGIGIATVTLSFTGAASSGGGGGGGGGCVAIANGDDFGLLLLLLSISLYAYYRRRTILRK